MLTNNIESENLSPDLFNTSTLPYEHNNYDLATEFTNNNQAINSGEQLLFIDSQVAEYQTLIDDLTELTEVIILDQQRDGIEQITESLQQYDDLATVHIVSHGNVGQLSLGNSTLNQDSLNYYQDPLTSWAGSLREDADILLYGCNVAADPLGTEFVESLSQYTQADILASTDLTGSADKNGDWTLEYATGEIESNLAWSAEINQNYQHVLNQPPIFENGTFFRSLPPDITLPGSEFFGAPIRVELDKFFDAPNISIDRPVVELPVTFDHSIMGNSDFRIDYTPLDLSMLDSEIDADAPLINFSQAENQPFSLNFANGNFSWIRNSPNYDYRTAKINSLIFPFDASSLNFNANSFEFTSVSLNRIDPVDPDRDSITFEFAEGTFDFSSLTSRSTLAFELDPGIFDFYKLEPNNRVQVDEHFFFDATAVTFRSNSITFDFRPSSLVFNPLAFIDDANLFDYKLTKADIESGVKFTQLNASDYRALDYAFPDDELFNSQYYSNTHVVGETINPFTDYIENGWRAGRNPNGLFNVDYYLSQNGDVDRDGEEPLTHYAIHGETEIFDNRDPNRLFDTSYYLAKNPDVADAGKNALLHYIESGWKESRIDNPGGFNPDRDPSPFFDTSYYFETYSDVESASYQLDSANALQHFLEFGPNGSVAVENRTPHRIFESQNAFKFTKIVTPNSSSQDILNAQRSFQENNLNLTTNEDGTFSISNFNNTLNPETATAVVLTFVGGGSISPTDTVDDSELDSKFVLDRDLPSGGIDSFSTAGYTTISVETPEEDLISIGLSDPSLSDLLNENREFSGLQESLTFAEFFQPETINDEDFTIYPQDAIFLPIKADSENGDEALDSVVDNGILVSDQDNSVFVTPTLRGVWITYDPNDFTNAPNNSWDSFLGATGRTTVLFGKTIPVRSSLPPRINPITGEEIEPRTHGEFSPSQIIRNGIGPNLGNIKFVSGRSDFTESQRPAIESSSRSFEVFPGESIAPQEVFRRVGISLVHAEGHAAVVMGLLGLTSGRIVINNFDGPCRNCRTGIPKLLPRGATLEVIYNNGQEELVVDTFIGGQLFTPSRDRKIFKIDF